MAPKKKTKEYKRIGQIYPIPDKEDSLRKFYRSLHRQKKDSKMAMKWLLEHGLFSQEKASRIDMILKMDALSIKK